MSKLHISAWVIVAALLVGGYFYVHHLGVQAERDKHTADSLLVAQVALNQAVTAQQDSLTAQKGRETVALRNIRVRDSALKAANGRLGALASVLRDSIGPAQQRQLDALEALHAQQDSILIAQREGYRILFEGASAQRDTLAGLVRALQAQTAGLAQALVQARRTPIYNTTIVRAVEFVLAVRGGFALAGK